MTKDDKNHRIEHRRAVARAVLQTAGVASLAVGLWWKDPSTALIVVGALIVGVSLLGRLWPERTGR